MAKGKKSKGKKDGIGTKKAIGVGALGGAASFVAGKVAGEAVKEVVKTGAKWLLDLPQGAKAVDLRKDLGVRVLMLLCDRGRPVPLARLPVDLGVGLLAALDTVQALRRVRMVKYAAGRRLLQLTPLGREALAALPPVKTDASADDGDKSDAGMGSDDGPVRQALTDVEPGETAEETPELTVSPDDR